MKQKVRNLVFVSGGLMLVVGAALIITHWVAAPYIYIAGSLLFAAIQLTERYKGDNFVLKRLYRQQKFGALVLVATGAAMLFMKHNQWIVFLTIGVLFELYTAFRIPQELDKETAA